MKLRVRPASFIFIGAAVCAALVTVFLFYPKSSGKVFIVRDALDPLADILEPYANDSMECLTPYQLGQRLSGLNGMAFVFGTQARSFQTDWASSGYVPLYSATVVIAVKRDGAAANRIDGWHSLISSGATVLMPQNATEGGRLAAAAMALGLGSEEGDFTPALDALTDLYAQGRLNVQKEYFTGYDYMYNPERLTLYDAVIMWDYQAQKLTRMSDEWDIIVPMEGAFTVDCGFLYAGAGSKEEQLLSLREFLSSEQGRRAFADAGFSLFTKEVDLSAWDWERLIYNPRFRRGVLSDKLYGPASVLERLLLQCTTLLLFCVAAQRVLRRIPRGTQRVTSFYSMLLVAVWMLFGISKTLTLNYDVVRYLWYATYIPRHFLPICWYAMCCVNRYDGFPSRKSLVMLGSAAALLTAFVFTNDFHRQIFVFLDGDSATWANHYVNGWGYYVSLIWSFSLSITGVGHLLRKKMTRRQRRQMLYATAFFAVLIVYQVLYIIGVKHILDLEIPTTVAIFMLLFNFAAQQERFMGASLLDLPVFKHSPYGIAVYDGLGHPVYQNDIMDSVEEDVSVPDFSRINQSSEVAAAERIFKSRIYALDTGWALVLEDISDLKRLEKSLRQTHKKLMAVQQFLVRQTQRTDCVTGCLERERYTQHMNELFYGKMEQMRRCLGELAGEEALNDTSLKRVRFLVSICQQRLRFIIRHLEAQRSFPVKLIERYAQGVLKDGRRLGLDGVVTASGDCAIASNIAGAALEFIDLVCLAAFDLPDSSLICRIETGEADMTINAIVSWEDGLPPYRGDILSAGLVDAVHRLGGRICRQADEDGMIVRLRFPGKEAQ